MAKINIRETVQFESMKFKMDGMKLAPTRTNYPKTNLKRTMDEWNDKVYSWAHNHTQAGHVLLQRKQGGGFLIVDALDGVNVIETMVVSNHGELHNDTLINFYKQGEGASPNEYSDYEHGHVKWTFKAANMSELHHSDQRNVNTSKHSAMKNKGRVQDGKSLQALARSTRKQ